MAFYHYLFALKLKKQYIIRLASVLVLILVVNYVSSLIYLQKDLTADKRYTLSAVTKDFLTSDLEQPIHIDLYLDGSINSGFNRLEKATLSMLKQFRSINRDIVSFDHVIIDKKDRKEGQAIVKALSQMQVSPMNVIEEDNDGKRTEKAVYPWAVVSYGGNKRPVKLLVNVNSKSGQENLNSSIENLEYNFTEAFRLLTDTADQRIAFLEGHGELDEASTYDITTSLSYFYSVDRGQIGSDASILDIYKAVVIAQPTEAFSETEKYVLDQYIMKGGAVLWLVDGVKMSMDSLSQAKVNYGVYNDVNLADMLFRYGVRINGELMQDMQCALYPVNIAQQGAAPRYQPLPWFYAPLLQPNSQHAITRYNSNVRAEFVSSLDTIGGNENIKKSFLLSTSEQSKVVQVPMPIDLGMSVNNMKLEEFTAGQQNVAVLLEGQFKSPYTNRSVPKGIINAGSKLSESVNTKMVVIADGELIKNDIRGQGEQAQIVPLGYDYASKQVMFGNKDFLLNTINYLTDDRGWYELRERTVKLRLLDKKEQERRQYYRALNIGLPLVCILLLALLVMGLQKRKYAK